MQNHSLQHFPVPPSTCCLYSVIRSKHPCLWSDCSALQSTKPATSIHVEMPVTVKYAQASYNEYEAWHGCIVIMGFYFHLPHSIKSVQLSTETSVLIDKRWCPHCSVVLIQQQNRKASLCQQPCAYCACCWWFNLCWILRRPSISLMRPSHISAAQEIYSPARLSLMQLLVGTFWHTVLIWGSIREGRAVRHGNESAIFF